VQEAFRLGAVGGWVGTWCWYWWGCWCPRGQAGTLCEVCGCAGGNHGAVGRAERRGGRVVVYGSHEDRKRLVRVAELVDPKVRDYDAVYCDY